jgi:ABC-type amino acid transport substrate-binding protein
LKQAENGEIDGVLSLIPNPDRAAYLNQSMTLIGSPVVYIAQKGKPKLSDASQLEGWTIAGVRASSSLKMAQKLKDKVKNITFVEEDNNEDLVKKTALGRYGDKGAATGSEDVLMYFAKKNNTPVDTILSLEVQDWTVGFSKKKMDEATTKQFNDTLAEMKKSGELQKILAPYSLKVK